MAREIIPTGKYKARATEGIWCAVGEKETSAVGVKFEFDVTRRKARRALARDVPHRHDVLKRPHCVPKHNEQLDYSRLQRRPSFVAR